MTHAFTAGFLFSGLGAGALGFLQAQAKLGQYSARFTSVGGIDCDADACFDFEYLTQSPGFVGDLSCLSIATLRAYFGDVAPHCLFLSPPCKGFSASLSQAMALTPKYLALNELVLQGLFLACEAWPTPPALIVLENVPRIKTRGSYLLDRMRALLRSYGYVFHESTHDCGVIGNLAQSRPRYLLVARLPSKVPNFVYQPPKHKLLGVGSVLGTLPPPIYKNVNHELTFLHRLPELAPQTWDRLRLIPARGDWQSLPSTKMYRSGPYGVLAWDQPSYTITGNACHDNGYFSVADPRVEGLDPRLLAADGTWHRPMTTLELAALQGLPTTHMGRPLTLAGKSQAKQRERVGNAVPVGAAKAIATSLLYALLGSALEQPWGLHSSPIWVQEEESC